MNAKKTYLDLVSEDAWVDSGTGNMAWKEPKRRKRAIDRVPRKRILEMIHENVSLIKTIDAGMFPDLVKKIEKLLNRTIDADEFIDWCVDECDVSEGRARIIAFDQINKIKMQIKAEDFKLRGIEYAVWVHEKECNVPREYHRTKWDGKSGVRSGRPNGLDGFVFRLDRLPVIDKRTGERGLPGRLIGCCCSIKGIRGA